MTTDFLKQRSIDYDAETGRMLQSPRQIFLELSSRCNLACVHCSKDFGTSYGQPEQDMTLQTIERLAPWLRDADAINLNMVGESLLSPIFDQVVALCCQGEATVHFNTNGLLMHRRRCDHVVAHGVHSVDFSLDGGETNRRVRGVPYEAIKRRIVALDRAKQRQGATLPLIGIAYTLMKSNLKELPLVLEDLLGSADIHCVHLQPLVVFYETLRGENVYDMSDVDEVVDRCREIASRHGCLLSLFRSSFAQDERSCETGETTGPQVGAFSERFGCVDPFYEIKIRSTGDVMSCSYGMMGGLHLWEHGLDEIWNGPWYRDLRKRLYAKRFEGRCASCPFIFGSQENQLAPLQPGVHHSQAARFLGYDPLGSVTSR